MIPLVITGKVLEQVVSFRDIRNGECFIMITPPTLWERLKGVVMIRLSENRIQELSDCNIRLTVKQAIGACQVVSINTERVSL